MNMDEVFKIIDEAFTKERREQEKRILEEMKNENYYKGEQNEEV